jgi:glycosyltransferase involved in cell wall biosynthesis
MESLACGLPVVASQVGGVPEIITNPDYGIMIPSRNIEKLAEALKHALLKSWDHDKIRSAVKDRTWDHVAEELYNEINLVLNR